MHLVIFDIDGTLIHSHQLESQCFQEALEKVVGITEIDPNLASYQHVSDHGIANELIFRRFQRDATETEQRAIENEFIERFSKTLLTHPPQPIPGVHAMHELLNNNNNIALAIATGCYLRSAQLKFTHASLPLHHLPIGTSNDSPVRTNIMEAAHHKAKQHYHVTSFDSITYIGDGPWDVRAVQALDWNFVGIASNYSEQHLQTLGVKHVVQNYRCANTFIQKILDQL